MTLHLSDRAKAARVLLALPLDADWITALARRGPLHRIPYWLAEAVYAGHETLAHDFVDFVDPELASAHHALVAALEDLSDQIGGTFPPQRDEQDYTEVPPEWKRTEPDRYYKSLRDLSTARHAVLHRYRKLINAMNRSGHLPSPSPPSGQSVSVTSGDNSPVHVFAPHAHASQGATADANVDPRPEPATATTPWWNRSIVLWTALGALAAVAAAVAAVVALHR
ncbi:hypothetical protein [Wenjunlia tyrosinilytica]|uniref:Uncharacterized protein n=1 Tax=Wenjunlia tyrosinilytica TaxID=1544741 RepID=A0A917ZY20_9ACTN|nr:hypothetical protein [Wenjunlia tyrosinilytica]GGP00316.1 hypothetical protein GCM10012280_68800 [Wenjunlia tyrosinilytica]